MYLMSRDATAARDLKYLSMRIGKLSKHTTISLCEIAASLELYYTWGVFLSRRFSPRRYSRRLLFPRKRDRRAVPVAIFFGTLRNSEILLRYRSRAWLWTSLITPSIKDAVHITKHMWIIL